ncbi:MAG: hypothetical protein IT285_05610 [Bdellovibrionales bacterium]|nr:hypothetical protein [Bdellovibrionales bacterium]
MSLATAGSASANWHDEPLPWFPMPWEPACGKNYLSENYGLAQGAAYLGQTMIPPSTANQLCQRLGREAGEKLARDQANNQPWCNRAFDRGLQSGLRFEVPTVETPSECWHAGYALGAARLENALRRDLESEVGSRCMREYRRGWTFYKEQKVPELNGDNFTNHCFMTGYDDASIAP